MFHHYSENFASTGEPPTPPSSNLPEGATASSQRQPRGSSASLGAQEPDSGYEASPSSLADNHGCTMHFFGEHSSAPEASVRDSVFLFLDDSDDEWDLCPECRSHADDCDCYRNDSVAVALSDLSSSRRPSSSPVQIPSPRVDLRPSRSHPDFPGRGRTSSFAAFGLVSGSHPLSWPSAAAPWIGPGSPLSAALTRAQRSRTNRTTEVRSRRRLIDSDASSLSSSDEEGPEDVFGMAGESGVLPLPDLVLGSGSSGDSRRSRSQSVNLPLEQEDPNRDSIQAIGRTLRRLSDQFEQRRQVRCPTARRMTISDFIHFRGS